MRNKRREPTRRKRIANTLSPLSFQTLEPRQLMAAVVSSSGDIAGDNSVPDSLAQSASVIFAGPIISEFLASNANTIEDDNGNSTDFIEIFNASFTPVNLSGYSLTDDADEPSKYVFPNVNLASGEYLVVFAGDDTNPNSGTDLYTGFGLSSSGEYLGFFDPAGNVVSEFGANGADFPAQFTDVSFGVGAADLPSFLATPTPGAANAGFVEGVTSRVNSSVTPGFYEGTISVELTTATAGASIYYTTDGSTPTTTNGSLYNPNFPIEISSTTNLRAVSVLENYLSDFDRTYSYLFVEDILDQSVATTEAAGFPDEDNRPNGGQLDYGIDPDVLSIEGRQAVAEALLSIPSIAITTNIENLFDPNTGIYTNSGESGREYERPASVELLNPDGSEGFQVNAGLRIRGGFSRRTANPQHSFRLLFRSEYGDSELNYPLHGEDSVSTFQNLDLRTAQNYSYQSEGDPTNNFIAEVFSRQNQGLNGDLTTQSTWAHLYLNGQYWGLYQTQERAEADFAASYLGGDSDDFDVVAPDSDNGLFIQATDGNTDAYFRLFQQANALAPDNSTPAFVDDAAYYRAQGLNPDGTRNLDFEVLLDVDNLINYVTEIQYSGNFDSGISRFIGDARLNNFQAIRDRTSDEGFRFFVHDAEHSHRELNVDRTGPFTNPEFDNARSFNPLTLHERLLANAEYRIAFADSIQDKFFNDGIYTTENLIARWEAEAEKISVAIIAESARWGDAHFSRTNNPILQSDWENAIADVRDNILTQRNEIYLEQLRDYVAQLRDTNGNFTINVPTPLIASFDSPIFQINSADQHGGTIEAGDVISISASETIYYTTDGSDPRLQGGGINPNAIAFDASVTNTTVFANGSDWRFLDDGSNQGTAWRNPNFDDSSWRSGESELGFGDAPETTTQRFDSNGNQVITTYFRRTFDVTEGFDAATLELFYDDGAAVYLNGNLVDTVNLNGPINFQTRAASVVGDGTTAFLDVSDFLVIGSNTLAIEIHQVNAFSSDLSFNAELTTSTVADVGGIVLDSSTNIRARTFSNGEWSGIVQAAFVVPGTQLASQSDLRITEINYNPLDSSPGADNGGDFEFIEIFNPTTSSINLDGVQFTDGVVYSFANVNLLPGERAVVVEDTIAFRARYGDSIRVLGEWSGGLSNSGERITLSDSSGSEIQSVNYDDSGPWDFAADGQGFTLVLDDPINTPVEELGKYYSWRASTELGGTPGAASASPSGIVINEVLANSDANQSDLIELFNPTSVAINVGGWFLSDSSSDLFRFQIPGGTVIEAGGYLVFDESDFNPTPSTPASNHFAFSGEGDQAYLSRIASGLFLRLEDSVDFGATFSGESLGLTPDGSGQLVRLAQSTFGAANSQGQAGPLVISEVNYHPANPSSAALAIDPLFTENDLEFIEIFNPTSSSIDLTNYRIRGEVDFDFAASTSLASAESLLLVSFDPSNSVAVSAFEAHYGISDANLFGPWEGGSLSNADGRVSLQAPNGPSSALPDEIPHVVIDELLYDDLTAAVGTDGDGLSLNRIADARNGNDPSEFTAEIPTPGSVDLVAVTPTIVSFVRDSGSDVRPDLLTTFDVTFSSDVAISASALQLFNDSTGGNLVNLSGVGFSYDSSTFTATWNFSTLPDLDAAFYTASLNAGLVTGSIGGQTLDGDANGTAGGDFLESVYVAIPGDANLDGRVDVLRDAFILVSNLGSTGNAWTDGDFNADGGVTVLGDAFTLIGNLGRSVVPPAASQFVTTPNQSASSPVILAETPTIVNVSKESEKTQAATTDSAKLVLAGSQVIDDVFAGEDWLI